MTLSKYESTQQVGILTERYVYKNRDKTVYMYNAHALSEPYGLGAQSIS